MKKILSMIFLNLFVLAFCAAQNTYKGQTYYDLLMAAKDTVFKINVTTLNTRNDTIAIHGVYFKEAVVVDSIQMTMPASTGPVAVHAAGTILANSATAGNVVWLKFLNVAAVASGHFRIEDMAVSSDSLCAFSGLLILNNDTLKLLKIADNAQNNFGGENFNQRVAELPFSLQTSGVGTGSTSVWDYQTFNRWATADASKNVYGKIVATSSATPKFNGWMRFKLKVLQQIIVP